MIELARKHGPFDPRYPGWQLPGARPKAAQDRAVAAQAAEQAWHDDGGPAVCEDQEASR